MRSRPTTTSTTRRSPTPPPWPTPSGYPSRRPLTGRGRHEPPVGHQPVPLRSVDRALRRVQPSAHRRGPGRQLPRRCSSVSPREADDAAILATLSKALPSTPYGPVPFTANAGLPGGGQPVRHQRGGGGPVRRGGHLAALSLVRKLWGYMDAPGPDYTGADWELVGAERSARLRDRHQPGPRLVQRSHGRPVLLRPRGRAVHGRLPNLVGGAPPWTPVLGRGQCPHPQGPIEVRWAQNPSSGRFALQVTAPATTSGTISVPVPGSGAVVTFSATGVGRDRPLHRVKTAAPGSSYISLTVAGGATYDVEVTPK